MAPKGKSAKSAQSAPDPPDGGTQYDQRTVANLRKDCRTRGLSSSGLKKQDYVDLLIANDIATGSGTASAQAKIPASKTGKSSKKAPLSKETVDDTSSEVTSEDAPEDTLAKKGPTLKLTTKSLGAIAGITPEPPKPADIKGRLENYQKERSRSASSSLSDAASEYLNSLMGPSRKASNIPPSRSPTPAAKQDSKSPPRRKASSTSPSGPSLSITNEAPRRKPSSASPSHTPYTGEGTEGTEPYTGPGPSLAQSLGFEPAGPDNLENPDLDDIDIAACLRGLVTEMQERHTKEVAGELGLKELENDPEGLTAHLLSAVPQGPKPIQVVQPSSMTQVAGALRLSLAEYQATFQNFEGRDGQIFRRIWEEFSSKHIEPERKKAAEDAAKNNGNFAKPRGSQLDHTITLVIEDRRSTQTYWDTDRDLYEDRLAWNTQSWDCWFLGRTLSAFWAKPGGMLHGQTIHEAASKLWALKLARVYETSPARIGRLRKRQEKSKLRRSGEKTVRSKAALSRTLQQQMRTAVVNSNPGASKAGSPDKSKPEKSKPDKPKSSESKSNNSKPAHTPLRVSDDKHKPGGKLEAFQHGHHVTTNDWKRLEQATEGAGLLADVEGEEKPGYDLSLLDAGDDEDGDEDTAYLRQLRNQDPFDVEEEVVIDTSTLEVEDLETMARDCPLLHGCLDHMSAKDLVNLVAYENLDQGQLSAVLHCLCRFHSYRVIEALTAGSFNPNSISENLSEFLTGATGGKAAGDIAGGTAVDATGEISSLTRAAELDSADLEELVDSDPFDSFHPVGPQRHAELIKESKDRTNAERLVNYHGSADLMREGTKRVMMADQVTGGVSYDLEDLTRACQELQMSSPLLRKQPLANSGVVLKWWQAIAAAEVSRLYKEGKRGIVLSDLVGLGKTYSLLAVAVKYLEDCVTSSVAAHQSPDPAVQATAKSLLPKPVLISVPTTLIKQWEGELRKYSSSLDVHIYHGDGRHKLDNANHKTIIRTISKDEAAVFRFQQPKPGQGVKLTVILTGHETFRSRHGPSAFDIHTGMPQEEHVKPDKFADWPANLVGKFDLVIIDEAHALRNPDTQTNAAFRWLEAKFYYMATATPVWHHYRDLAGMLTLLEGPDSEAKVRQYGQDPFKLSDDDERKAEMCITSYAWEHYVCSDEAHTRIILSMLDEDVDAYPVGSDLDSILAKRKVGSSSASTLAEELANRLNYVMKLIVIRRDYTCALPKGSKNTIGSTLPPRRNYTIDIQMDSRTRTLHDLACKAPKKNLMMGGVDGANRLPNGSKVRSLVLISSNPSFYYCEQLAVANDMFTKKSTSANLNQDYAINAATWLRQSVLYTAILDALRIKRPSAGLPKYSHAAHQYLCWLVQFSPKMRIHLAILADQVLRRKERCIVWCHYPAIQKLLTSIYQMLGIKARAVLSDLNPTERDVLINSFNDKPSPNLPPDGSEVDVLVCSYLCSPQGYNMDGNCRFIHKFDVAPNQAVDDQSTGRCYRISQTREVEEVRFNVMETYQNSMSVISKSNHVYMVMASIDREQLIEWAGFEGITERTKERIRDFSGFWAINTQIVHEDNPNFADCRREAEENGHYVTALDRMGIANFIQAVYEGQPVKFLEGLQRDTLEVNSRSSKDKVARNFELEKAEREICEFLTQLNTTTNQVTERERREEMGKWSKWQGESDDANELRETEQERDEYINDILDNGIGGQSLDEGTREWIKKSFNELRKRSNEYGVRMTPNNASRRRNVEEAESDAEDSGTPITAKKTKKRKVVEIESGGDDSPTPVKAKKARKPKKPKQRTKAKPAAAAGSNDSDAMEVDG